MVYDKEKRKILDAFEGGHFFLLGHVFSSSTFDKDYEKKPLI
jgi:hypothetical protein